MNQYYESASLEKVATHIKDESIPWGSSVIGICYDKGVLIAADTCVHYGSIPQFQNMDRVFKISEQINMGGGGDFGGIQKYKCTIDAQELELKIHVSARQC